MYYQDSNDYMRDSYFCGNGMNNNMMYGNMQNPYMQNNYQMPMSFQQNGMNYANSLEKMYPQIYRIISPVANRVISNSNYQYMTEDSLNNMTDTVYNIIEGDVSSLVSTQNPNSQGDDTVQVNANIATNNSRGQNSGANNSTNNPSTDRRGTNNSNDNNSGNNRLLRDLIKIILIKELLSRRNNNYFMQNQGMQMGNYNPMNYGMF